MTEFKVDLTRYKRFTMHPRDSDFFDEAMHMNARKGFEYLEGLSEEYGTLYFLVPKNSRFSCIMNIDAHFIIAPENRDREDKDYYIHKEVIHSLETLMTQLKEHLNK